MKTRTLDLASDWGLDFVEITEGMNGSPKNLHKALTGFDTFEDAECFADEVNGEVVLLSRRDGHHFWKCSGRAFDGIEREHYVDEEHYEIFKDEYDFEYWASQKISSKIGMGDNIFDLRNALTTMCKTYKEISDMCGGQIAIVDKSDYTCEIENEYVTKIHDDDVTTYMIAVVDHEKDEDETNEEE